jgi:hypothetical protein
MSRLTFGASVSHFREWLWKEMTAGYCCEFLQRLTKNASCIAAMYLI